MHLAHEWILYAAAVAAALAVWSSGDPETAPETYTPMTVRTNLGTVEREIRDLRLVAKSAAITVHVFDTREPQVNVTVTDGVKVLRSYDVDFPTEGAAMNAARSIGNRLWPVPSKTGVVRHGPTKGPAM